MTKARERAYERRRYEEWQTRLNQRKRRRRQAQRIALAALSSIAAVGVIIAVAFLVTSGDDDSSDTATSTPTPSASAAATPSASAAATPSAAAVKGGCTPSTLGAVSKPEQTTKVPAKSLAGGKTWNLALKTTCGDVAIRLDGAKAPQAVSSTIALARSGFYDKTPCHRLTTEGLFVLQCGDPTGTGTGGPGYQYGPLENVPKKGVYPAGTVAMARAQSESSQGSQFFLVYKDTELPGGYTVIGTVTKGLSVVEKVAKAGVSGGGGDGAPATPISILSTKVTQG